MYDYMKGILTHKSVTAKGCFAAVEVNGIGYGFEVMERDCNALPQLNSELKMFCVLIHREDKMSLCGFLRREDRDIFNVLTSVSGVGTKMALTLLNSFEVGDLAGFVIDENYKALTRAKGVGPKLAQKIILELKDKMTSYNSANVGGSTGTVSVNNGSQSVEDAKTVLFSLGYGKDEVETAMARVLAKISEESPAEIILKETLKFLSV